MNKKINNDGFGRIVKVDNEKIKENHKNRMIKLKYIVLDKNLKKNNYEFENFEKEDCLYIQDFLKTKGLYISLEQAMDFWEKESSKSESKWSVGLKDYDLKRLFKLLSKYFKINKTIKIKGQLKLINNEKNVNNDKYELYELKEENNKKEYHLIKEEMSREEFEIDRQKRDMNYLEYSHTTSIRHCDDKVGNKYAYFEKHINSKYNNVEEEEKLYKLFIKKYIKEKRIKSKKVFKEIIKNIITTGLNENFLSKIKEIESYFEENKRLFKLLKK